MPTHIRQCIVCGENVYCHNDEHALGCGGSCYDPPPYIEFCSLAHALELQATLADRIAIFREITETG